MSRMTIAAFQDMGYQVNYDAADPYTLPGASELSAMGITDEKHLRCRFLCPEPIILPESALVEEENA